MAEDNLELVVERISASQETAQPNQRTLQFQEIVIPEYLQTGKSDEFQVHAGRLYFVHRKGTGNSSITVDSKLVEYDPINDSFQVQVQDQVIVPGFLRDRTREYGALQRFIVLSPTVFAAITSDLPTDFRCWPGYNEMSSISTDPWHPKRAYLTIYQRTDETVRRRLIDLTQLLKEKPPEFPQRGADASRSMGAKNPIYQPSAHDVESQWGVAVTRVDDLWYDPQSKTITTRTGRSTCHVVFNIYQKITLDKQEPANFVYSATCDEKEITRPEKPEPDLDIVWGNKNERTRIGQVVVKGERNPFMELEITDDHLTIPASEGAIKFQPYNQMDFLMQPYNRRDGYPGKPKIVALRPNLVIMQSDALCNRASYNHPARNDPSPYHPKWFKISSI